jgi:hypothetical protein
MPQFINYIHVYDHRVRELQTSGSGNRMRSESPNKRARVEEHEDVIENAKSKPSYATAAAADTMKVNGQGEKPPLKRRPSTLFFGEAKIGKGDTEELFAADANLVASGVSKDATAEQLKDFLVGKGIGVTDTNTFRIAIKVADYDKAMNPSVWPYFVGVRRFKPKRYSNNWADQSKQSGGNIQTDQRKNHEGQGQYRHGSRPADRHQHSGGFQHGQGCGGAPGAPSFELSTQNRFNGLMDNEQDN